MSKKGKYVKKVGTSITSNQYNRLKQLGKKYNISVAEQVRIGIDLYCNTFMQYERSYHGLKKDGKERKVV